MDTFDNAVIGIGPKQVVYALFPSLKDRRMYSILKLCCVCPLRIRVGMTKRM